MKSYLWVLLLVSGCTVQVAPPTPTPQLGWVCATFNGRVGCDARGLYYSSLGECAPCPIGEACLAVPNNNEPETGVCQ